MRCRESKSADKTGKHVRDDSTKQFSILPHPTYFNMERYVGCGYIPNSFIAEQQSVLIGFLSRCMFLSFVVFELDLILTDLVFL